MGKGIFYAVSVGAGDPLDMTLRAKQVLEQADVVVAPVTKQGSASAAYTIAAQAADLSRAQILEMLFPMKAHTDYRERLRSGILQPVCAALDEGKLVAMVTLGDVSVYSTASYVRQLLEEKGYETRVAAGAVLLCRRSQGKAEPLRKREDAGNLARRGIPGSPGTGVRRIRQSGDYESRKGAVLAAAASGRTGTSGTHHNAPGCGHGIGICGQSPGRTVFLFYNPADSAERRMTWYILLVQAPETRNC